MSIEASWLAGCDVVVSLEIGQEPSHDLLLLLRLVDDAGRGQRLIEFSSSLVQSVRYCVTESSFAGTLSFVRV